MVREKLTSGTDVPNVAHDVQKRVIHGIIQVESHRCSVKRTLYWGISFLPFYILFVLLLLRHNHMLAHTYKLLPFYSFPKLNMQQNALHSRTASVKIYIPCPAPLTSERVSCSSCLFSYTCSCSGHIINSQWQSCSRTAVHHCGKLA